jgi:hypothetical protein
MKIVQSKASSWCEKSNIFDFLVKPGESVVRERKVRYIAGVDDLNVSVDVVVLSIVE